MQTATLFQELGGVGAISAVVDIFYDKVLGDPLLAPFFAGIDLDRLRRHQTMFVSMATDGPQPPASFDLGAAHARLGIGDEHFDRVVEHLIASLRVAAVEQHLIDAVVERIGALRSQVVSA